MERRKLGSKHLLHSITRESIEEGEKKYGEEEYGDHLQDRELVVVPYDIPGGWNIRIFRIFEYLKKRGWRLSSRS